MTLPFLRFQVVNGIIADGKDAVMAMGLTVEERI